MATERKRHFRMADSILWEGWDDKTIADFTRLCACLNVKWSREAVQEDGSFLLTDSDICEVTHLLRPLKARSRLLNLPERCRSRTMKIEIAGIFLRVLWPKFLQFQTVDPRSRAKAGEHPSAKPPLPSPSPSPSPTPTPSLSPVAAVGDLPSIAAKIRASKIAEEILRKQVEAKDPTPTRLNGILQHHLARGIDASGLNGDEGAWGQIIDNWLLTCRRQGVAPSHLINKDPVTMATHLAKWEHGPNWAPTAEEKAQEDHDRFRKEFLSRGTP